MEFLQNVIKSSNNEYASIVSAGGAESDIRGFVDTGSYTFNALVSGSLFGGIPDNKITAIAGESATGKSFFALSLVNSRRVNRSRCLLFLIRLVCFQR